MGLLEMDEINLKSKINKCHQTKQCSQFAGCHISNCETCPIFISWCEKENERWRK